MSVSFEKNAVTNEKRSREQTGQSAAKMDGETIYGSEYAKSNRAACKLCKKNIGMGSLRLAIFVQVYIIDT